MSPDAPSVAQATALPEAPGLSEQVLLDLYRIAIEEYRFNVSQNSDRQKFFVGLNVALSSIVPGLFGNAAKSYGYIPSIVLAIAALTALLGIIVINRSHAYYRSARDHFQAVESRLNLRDVGLALSTTPGMLPTSLSGAKGSRWRVYRIVQGLLGVLLVADIVFAYLLLP